MGSGFAGVKAGILAGVFLAASIAIFNLVLLYAEKGQVMQYLSQVSYCAGTNSTVSTPDGCFSTIVNVSLPVNAFKVVVIAIFFAGLYGLYFERIPSRHYVIKAIIVSLLVLVTILLFETAGVSTDYLQTVALFVFDLFAVYVFAFITARLYRRYTREVRFDSARQLKITVDGHDCTGKTRTFSLHSSHTVRAPIESGAFKEWLFSGGVTVEDPRSFETQMRVDGDGLLRIA